MFGGHARYCIMAAEVAENADWGVLLLFGGGLTLSAILKDSGTSLVLGQTLANTFW